MTDAVPDWQEWYDAHAARLLLFARQWLPERADAEDAVQIGFVKFWRNRPRPAAADVPLLFAAVRSAALKALVSTRELDNVPTLIFALGDPDSRIVVLANRGLRGLSRRLDGFDMPEEPTEAVKREAIDRWKQWYLMIRPDAQFLN